MYRMLLVDTGSPASDNHSLAFAIAMELLGTEKHV